MSELPPGFLPLGTTEVGDEVAQTATWTFRAAASLGALGVVLSMASSLLLIPSVVALLVGGLAWTRARVLRDLPFAVNANHPWILDQAMGKAEVAVRAADERWVVLGDVRLKLHTDPLLGDPLLVEANEPWDTVVRWPQAPPARLQRWLVIGNTALALRDAVNGHDEEAEEQRRRAADDTELLDRQWPEEEDTMEEGLALTRWLESARPKK